MDLEKRKRRYLQIALVLIGCVFLLLYPLMQMWPSGWVWLPRQHEYEQMMIGVYGNARHLLDMGITPAGGTFKSNLVHIRIKFGSRHYHGHTSRY
jgi:hypothetical protein